MGSKKTDVTKNRFVWIDMEMTGLEPETHHILEVACIVTKPSLEPLHEGISMVIHHPDDVLANMNSWSLKSHAETGLTQACKESQIKLETAEKLLYNYVKKHTTDGTNYLAGNTVYMDRRFLEKYMPSVDALLHYRIIDVSAIKELCRHWCPDKYASIPQKKNVHRALGDINESIQELKAYQEIFLR